MFKRILLIGALLFSFGANAQTATTLHGTTLTGSPPTGYADQPLRFNCSVTPYCWPLLQIYDGTTLATVNADNGLNSHVTNFPATQPISAVSLPLPTGAMGSSGGSVTANAGTNLNTSTLATQTTLAAIATAQSNGTQQNKITDGTTIAAVDPTSTGLKVYLAGGVSGSGGTAMADNAAWAVGSTNMTPFGCEFTIGGATAISTAHAGVVACTTARAMFTDKTSVNGTALATATESYGTLFTSQTATVERVDAFVTNTNTNVGNNVDAVATSASAGSPVIDYLFGFNGTTWDRLQVDASKFLKVDCAAGCSSSTAITSWGGGTLGAMSNFGATPGAVLVPGIDASLFIGTTAAAAGHGTAATALRVELPTDGTGVVGLNAGTNLIGKAGIDQTTVGTTNGVSLAQIGATTISSGTGAVGTGSQRVAVGTDTATIAGSSPTATLSLALHQSTNVDQINGVTTSVGTGAVGTGAQRIAVGTDTATIAGSSPTGVLSLAANQSVNLAQVAGSASGVVAVSTAPTTAGNVAQVMDLRPDSPGIIALGANTAALSVPMVPATDKVQGTPSSAVTGSYCMSSVSGTMAAGLAANAPIFSLRYAGSGVALIRRVRFSANDGGTAFTAGTVQFQLFAARSYSVADTGGAASTLTGNNGKLRTSFASTSMADFRTSSTATLTAGTRTLDATPLGSWDTSVPATIATPIIGPVPLDLVRPEYGEQPVQLATSEGLVLQATVPATGVWVFAMQVCWDEVAAY